MSVIQFEPVLFDTNLPIFFTECTIYTEIENKNWHEHIELIFVVEGSGQVLYDSEYISIKKNDFCVINANCLHSARGDVSGMYFYNVGISSDFCNYNGIDIQNYQFTRIFTDSLAKKKLEKLKKAYYAHKDSLYYAGICSALLELTIHLTKKHAEKKTSKVKETNIMYSIGYIKSNINRKLTIDEIILQSGLRKYYFCREFKKLTGYTVIDYINVLRCERACQFLKSNTYSVYDVFQLSCFDNFSYFSKMFKKHIGISPSEYLQKVKNNQITS